MWARVRRPARCPRVGVLQRGHRLARAAFAADGSCPERNRSSWFWLSGRCANAASVGRMPATRRSRCRFHASGAFGPVVSSTPRIDHSAREMSVLRRSRRTRPCACASASSPAISSRARLHQMVIGDPQLGQAAEMLRLIRARLLEEVLEPGPVGPRRRVTGQGDRRLEDLGHQRLDEGLLRGEVAVQRAHADAGRARPRRPRWPRAPSPRRPDRPQRADAPGSSGRRCASAGSRSSRPGPLRASARARIRRFHSAYPSGRSGAVDPLRPGEGHHGAALGPCARSTAVRP